MKVLVTGGAGFIGSHIVDRIVDEGHEAVIVDDLSTGNERNINKNAEFYKLNVLDEVLESVFRDVKPDVVSHQAAQKDVRLSVSDPIHDARINILGTLNLLQNCIKHKVKKVTFASTGGAIYGEQDIYPALETHPARPLSPYGITKLVAEHYLYFYKRNYGLDYVSLRYSNVYGPRQDPHGEAGVVAIFIQKMLDREQPVINGDGKQTRDFVYVNDVARANLLAMERNTSDNVFNIGTGIETSINEIFEYVRNIIDPSVHKKNGPAMRGEQLRSVVECSRAKELLDWKPEVSISDGLRMTCEYFQGHND